MFVAKKMVFAVRLKGLQVSVPSSLSFGPGHGEFFLYFFKGFSVSYAAGSRTIISFFNIPAAEPPHATHFLEFSPIFLILHSRYQHICERGQSNHFQIIERKQKYFFFFLSSIKNINKCL